MVFDQKLTLVNKDTIQKNTGEQNGSFMAPYN